MKRFAFLFAFTAIATGCPPVQETTAPVDVSAQQPTVISTGNPNNANVVASPNVVANPNAAASPNVVASPNAKAK